MIRIDGSTQKYCLIGDPVKHSLSPIIMNKLFHEHGFNSIYFTCKVVRDRLGEGVAGLRALGIKGFNVTIPHKVDILRYLDSVSEDVLKIGAVNTVLNTGNQLIGYNTDWIGVANTFKQFGFDKFDKCVLLGAGGAARAVLFALEKICSEVIIFNRTFTRSLSLASRYRDSRCKVIAKKWDKDVIRRELSDADLLINATPLGMDGVSTPISKEFITGKQVVFDLVYSPLNTPLLNNAREKDAFVIDGLWMLIHQAAAAFNIWTGVYPETNLIREFLEEEMRWRDME